MAIRPALAQNEHSATRLQCCQSAVLVTDCDDRIGIEPYSSKPVISYRSYDLHHVAIRSRAIGSDADSSLCVYLFGAERWIVPNGSACNAVAQLRKRDFGPSARVRDGDDRTIGVWP
jgi:hypothetical protein